MLGWLLRDNSRGAKTNILCISCVCGFTPEDKTQVQDKLFRTCGTMLREGNLGFWGPVEMG